jgi:hypothetical protein
VLVRCVFRGTDQGGVLRKIDKHLVEPVAEVSAYPPPRAPMGRPTVGRDGVAASIALAPNAASAHGGTARLATPEPARFLAR